MIEVWAPLARQAELLIGNEPYPLQRAEDGWWRAAELNITAPRDYWFRIDGERFADPRSPWQPEGVHGPSRFVNHADFPWTDQQWQPRPLASAIVYEVHTSTFTPEGTFEAAISRLDHLVNLGVTHVELTPVAEFLGDYGWGYDGVFPYAPHHAWGGPQGLKRLVNACHEKGLAVLLDVVYNHLGPSGNYLPRFGPYFTERHHTPWGAALNFDGPHSDEVRRYFIDNAKMWLRDYHFDGLRLDAVHAIVDTSAMHLLEELACEVEQLSGSLGRSLVLVAESDLNDPRIIHTRDIGGYGLDAQWSDDFHHALHAVLTGEQSGYYSDFGRIADLASVFRQPFLYAGTYSPHRMRRHGRRPATTLGHRFLAYAQNHDQIGNRANGERLSHLVGTDKAKIAAALVLLSPYVPMLFQGEEWAASSPFQYFVDFHAEPELARAVANGRQREFASFGWQPENVPDPTDQTTFLRSKLNWEEVTKSPHAEMLQWHRSLIELRNTIYHLTDLESVHTAYSEEQRWLRVDRPDITIVCNFGAKICTVPLERSEHRSVRLASKPAVEVGDGQLRLPGESVTVLGPAGLLATKGKEGNRARH